MGLLPLLLLEVLICLHQGINKFMPLVGKSSCHYTGQFWFEATPDHVHPLLWGIPPCLVAFVLDAVDELMGAVGLLDCASHELVDSFPALVLVTEPFLKECLEVAPACRPGWLVVEFKEQGALPHICILLQEL